MLIDEKKKQIALGSLFVVILAIGAFKFVGGGKASAVPPAKPASTTPANTVKSSAPVIKNPAFSNVLVQRDPFVSPIKPASMDAPSTGANPPPKPLITGSESSLPVLPQPGGSVSGKLGVEPVSPPLASFSYHLSGLIQGQHPGAVFSDAQGNQRLVSVGSALDGDSTLIKVEESCVIVNFRGQHLTLALGETPDGK